MSYSNECYNYIRNCTRCMYNDNILPGSNLTNEDYAASADMLYQQCMNYENNTQDIEYAIYKNTRMDDNKKFLTKNIDDNFNEWKMSVPKNKCDDLKSLTCKYLPSAVTHMLSHCNGTN